MFGGAFTIILTLLASPILVSLKKQINNILLHIETCKFETN